MSVQQCFLLCTAFDRHKMQKYNFASYVIAPDLVFFYSSISRVVSFFQAICPPNARPFRGCFANLK